MLEYKHLLLLFLSSHLTDGKCLFIILEYYCHGVMIYVNTETVASIHVKH